MYNKEKRICQLEECGKEFTFYLYPTNLKRGKGKYCSDFCRKKAKLNKNTVKCEYTLCGKYFKTFQSKKEEGKGLYCSKKCTYAGRMEKTRRFDLDGNLIEKQCFMCKDWKPINEYHKARKSYKNEEMFDTYCKRCKAVKTSMKLRYAPKEVAESIYDKKCSCESCGTYENIVADHCHKTNTFRGVLCSSCNSALGFVNDNPVILKKLAEYIERHKGV